MFDLLLQQKEYKFCQWSHLHWGLNNLERYCSISAQTCVPDSETGVLINGTHQQWFTLCVSPGSAALDPDSASPSEKAKVVPLHRRTCECLYLRPVRDCFVKCVCSWRSLTVNVFHCIKRTPFIVWTPLLTKPSFIRLHIVSQAQQGVCVCVCLPFVSLLQHSFYSSITFVPASQLHVGLFQHIMIMRVLLHHICQVQRKALCSASRLPNAENCLYVKEFLIADPPPSFPWPCEGGI